jgi:uncharacterized protein YbjT (DUF2867 family)
VVGATGHQGSAVVDALLLLHDPNITVRALTSNAQSNQAKALQSKGCEVVEMTWDDANSIKKAFNKCWGVFAMTTPFRKGQSIDKESEDGIRMVDAAFDAQVQFFMFTSVGGAERNTKIPHFESKRRVEEHLLKRASKDVFKMDYFILRPVFFIDNFDSFMAPRNGVISMPLDGDVKLQMVALADIGKCAARVFSNPEEYRQKSIELAGCEMTGNEVAAAFSRVTGRRIIYQRMPKTMAMLTDDMRIMFDWFENEGYKADLDKVHREYVPDTMGVEKWLKYRGYDNEEKNARFGDFEETKKEVKKDVKQSLVTAAIIGVVGFTAYLLYRKFGNTPTKEKSKK